MNSMQETEQDCVDEIRVKANGNMGPNLRVSNTAGTVIGWEVHCFFRDKNQLAQLRGQQPVRFEATVEGPEDGSTTLVLVDAVLR